MLESYGEHITSLFILLLVIIVGYSLDFVLKKKRRERDKKETERIEQLYQGKLVFHLDYTEEIRKESAQLIGKKYGDKNALRPGMKLVGPNGELHKIIEVYFNNEHPDKPSPEVPQWYVGEVALVIDKLGWDKKKAKELSKNGGVFNIVD